MLVARLRDDFVEAEQGIERGLDYICPGCEERVILKRGRIVIPHFAHKPGSDCSYGGESIRHMHMKLRMRELLSSWGRGVLEYVHGSNRADLAYPEHKLIVEVQHSPIGVDDFKQRVDNWHAAGWQILWVWDWERLNKKREPPEVAAQRLMSEVYALRGSDFVGPVVDLRSYQVTEHYPYVCGLRGAPGYDDDDYIFYTLARHVGRFSSSALFQRRQYVGGYFDTDNYSSSFCKFVDELSDDIDCIFSYYKKDEPDYEDMLLFLLSELEEKIENYESSRTETLLRHSSIGDIILQVRASSYLSGYKRQYKHHLDRLFQLLPATIARGVELGRQTRKRRRLETSRVGEKLVVTDKMPVSRSKSWACELVRRGYRLVQSASDK